MSRSLAQREFQGGQAIGRRIRVIDDGDMWSTVVGVVEDPSPTGIGGVLQPQYAVYLSVFQHPPTAADLVVRGPLSTDLIQATQPMFGAMRDSPTGSAQWRREPTVIAAENAPATWFGWWFGVQGWAMLGLAISGTFALMDLWVRSLRGEIAVRRAAGARQSQVLRLVLAQAMGVGVGGTLAGALLPAWRASRATPVSLLNTPL